MPTIEVVGGAVHVPDCPMLGAAARISVATELREEFDDGGCPFCDAE